MRQRCQQPYLCVGLSSLVFPRLSIPSSSFPQLCLRKNKQLCCGVVAGRQGLGQAHRERAEGVREVTMSLQYFHWACGVGLWG